MAILATVLTMLTLPALAHTPEEIDAWLAEWQSQIPATGMTTEHLEAFADFAERHFYHFHPSHAPVYRPTERAPKPAPPHRGMGSNVEQWRPLVTQYFPDPDRALCIMSYESGGNPDAENPSSGAAGLFQHLPKYWAERSVRAGWAGASIFDPTANIAVAAWLRIQDGWGHWSPYNRGLCH